MTHRYLLLPLLVLTACPEQVVVRETQAACGNGEVEVEEECDDGNSVDTDLCTGACRLARCGDGITVAINGAEDEACDDGNLEDTDACLSSCVPAVCGDGIMRSDRAEGEAGFEACDDGNDANDDGCLVGCIAAR